MLRNIKNQVQAQINKIEQIKETESVDKSRIVTKNEQCESYLKNILDRPEFSRTLSDMDLCKRTCQSVGVDFDDSCSDNPDKCIEMVSSAVVNYVNRTVVNDVSRKNTSYDSDNSVDVTSDDDSMSLSISSESGYESEGIEDRNLPISDDLNPINRRETNDEDLDRNHLKMRINAWLSKQSNDVDTAAVLEIILKYFDDKSEVLNLTDLSLSSLPDCLDKFYWVNSRFIRQLPD